MAIKRDVLIASFAAFSLIAAAAPASAKAQDSELGTGSAAKTEKKICKTFQNTASRMKATRLCLTKAEWKKFDETQR